MNPRYVIFYRRHLGEEFNWVFTQPNTFYDTEAEAEDIVMQLINENNIPKNQIKIQKLWIIETNPS